MQSIVSEVSESSNCIVTKDSAVHIENDTGTGSLCTSFMLLVYFNVD